MNKKPMALLACICVALIISCSLGKIDGKEAFACAQGYLDAIKAGDHQKALDYYSSSFDDATPENRMEKIKKLEEVMGQVSGFELKDSVRTQAGDLDAMSFTYRVTHSNVTSIEKFIIINDAGEYKIAAHEVQSENLTK
jgi:hypothetical protein